MEKQRNMVTKMSNGEFLHVNLTEAFTVKDFNRASKYKTKEEAQNDLDFLSLGDIDIRFNRETIVFDDFMTMETTLKKLEEKAESKEVLESKELLDFWEEHQRMEEWHGHDGHDARQTLYVIEEVLKRLKLKVKGINEKEKEND